MSPEVFQEISLHGAAVLLSTRAKFRLTGADRVRYLNGQVTNDVRRASASAALYACVTDVKGRISGDVFIHADDDCLFLDAEPGLREPLVLRLERYIVADDVELADVTDEWQLWHVFGGTETNVSDEAMAALTESRGHVLHSTRFGLEGRDIWLPAAAAFQPSIRVLNDDEAETWRILQNVPRWPHELGPDTFPTEAGIEARAMDFTKGCYIGQEVLSRIKTTGKMPRVMIALEGGEPLKRGDTLWTDKQAGGITSATLHPVTGRWVALAILRQGTDLAALHLHAADGPSIGCR